jgi:putative tryptophan/tyrosine transport system substrate-binding protein
MRGSRRRILGALGGSMAAWALSPALRAQQARGPYRIGFIHAADDRLGREFLEGMRELGYEEGRHYVLIARFYDRNRARIPSIADELIALRSDVIVTDTSGTAAFVKARTETIPIVMVSGIDPVGDGLAQSLAHPGGNVTGMTSLGEDQHARLVEVLHLLMPKARRIAFAVNPDRALAASYQAVATRAARSLGLELVPVVLRARWDVEALAEKLAALQADALVVSADAMLFGLREEIVQAGLAAGVPTLSLLPDFAQPGALATYGPDLAGNFRGAARYVDLILRGAKPAELPIGQPKQLELVLNVRTAKALRISIPQAVLLRADRVVE